MEGFIEWAGALDGEVVVGLLVFDGFDNGA